MELRLIKKYLNDQILPDFKDEVFERINGEDNVFMVPAHVNAAKTQYFKDTDEHVDRFDEDTLVRI